VVEGSVFNSVLSSQAVVGKGAKVEYSVLMPGAVVEPGAVVRFAILGENARVGENAQVGAEPDDLDNGWGVTTCGPNITIGAGALVAPGAMIYDDGEAVT
jgi:glucose-1-phosphate adenylyltransferase